MFVEYAEKSENRKRVKVNEAKLEPTEIIRNSGLKIKSEIYRKLGIELVFYSVEDAIKALHKLKNFKTSIRDNSVFIYSDLLK